MMKMTKFNAILKEHKDRVYSYALYLSKNQDDAEDITQEVFVKLYHQLENNQPEKPEAWLMRVTHNHCMDYMRRRSAVHRRQTDLKDWTHPGDYTDMESPDATVESKETRERLFSAMDQLPNKTRSILLLHYFQGMKLDEIAGAMELNLNTVKVTLHRGRKMLEDTIQQYYPELKEV